MVFIIKDSILYHYHLGFDPENVAILLTIRRPVFEELISEYIERYVTAYNFEENFGFKNFRVTEKEFGFLSSGKILIKDQEKVIISFPLKCDRGPTQKNLIALIITLSIIFDIFSYLIDGILNDQGKDFEQQSFVKLSYSRKDIIYGFSIAAELSPNFTHWIRNGEKYEEEVNALIGSNCLKSFKKLTRRNGVMRGSMGLGNKGFLFSGLYGVYSSQFGILGDDMVNSMYGDKYGYQTFCHNTDLPVDQIIHLIGFATLSQFAREKYV